MKRIIPFFISLSILLFSCSTDFDITADWQETAIVYGLLNPDDSLQYIRVEKVFLDENTSALQLAQISDSLYFQDSIKVTLRRANNGQVTELNLVNGNNIGSPKDSGDFAFDVNYLYQYGQPIDINDTYELKVENLNTGNIYTSSAPIVNDLKINFPPEGVGFLLNLGAESPTNIQWRSAKNGKIYEMKARFYYSEWEATTPADRDTFFIDWPIFLSEVSSTTNGNENMNYQLRGSEFYSLLSLRLSDDPSLRRAALSQTIKFIFTVGGEDLYNFINVNQAQTGITSLQSKPEFSNINGGLGIYSSRNSTETELYGLSQQALDSLSCGSKTTDLNFVNVNCF